MKKYIVGITLAMLMLNACTKKVDPIDGSNAIVTLVNAGTGFVTGDVTVNPKDSIFFSFTITSNKTMKYVSIQKNPVNQTAFVVRDTLTAANQNSYTITKRLRADSANGTYIYRIVAHDTGGVYIGHKDLVVTVTPDFYYYTVRVLQVPDTTAKTNTCYMAASTGNVYSYTTGAANSALIDFGFYYDTTGTLTPSTTDDLKFSLYALSAPQPQLNFYDISAWTKNATIMKKATAPTFASILSAGGLRSAAITNLTSGATNKVTALSTTVAGNNLVFFKTAAGKAGCMQINYINGTNGAKDSYANVDVKIER
jgi:hypothetical protein